jgi:hypothetical protein
VNALTTPADPDFITTQIDMLETYFDAELEPSVKRLYVDALRDLSSAHLRSACRRVVTTARFMPKVADLREAVDQIVQAERETARREAQTAARGHDRDPVRPFGRMSRYVVQKTFGAFVAHESCHCPSCWEAKPEGPPRFVPDGTNPDRICELCEDSGWTPGTSGGVVRCLCTGSNPNLRPDVHRVDMGRWIHGAELVEHERAQAAFFAALRRVGIDRRHLREGHV